MSNRVGHVGESASVVEVPVGPTFLRPPASSSSSTRAPPSGGQESWGNHVHHRIYCPVLKLWNLIFLLLADSHHHHQKAKEVTVAAVYWPSSYPFFLETILVIASEESILLSHMGHPKNAIKSLILVVEQFCIEHFIILLKF